MAGRLIFGVIFLVALVPLAFLVGLGAFAMVGSQVILGVAAFGGAVLLLILISLVSSTVSMILLAAVYVNAVEATVPGPLEPELLQGAFQSG